MTADARTASPAPAAPARAEPVLPSQALLQGQRSVAIEHNGAIYRVSYQP